MNLEQAKRLPSPLHGRGGLWLPNGRILPPGWRRARWAPPPDVRLPLVAVVVRTAISAQAGLSGTTFTTSAGTHTAFSAQQCDVLNFRTDAAGNVNTPTLAGANRTWVQEATVVITALHTNDFRVTRFRSMAATTDTSQQLTVSFGGQAQDNGAVYLDEFSGVDISGTNGSGAFVQTKPGSGTGTSLTITYDAVPKAGNGLTSIFGNVGGAAVTPRSGWTEGTEVAAGLDSQTRLGSTDTAASASWTGSFACLGIASELKAAVSLVSHPYRIPIAILAM